VRQAACRRVVLRRASQLNVCVLAINLAARSRLRNALPAPPMTMYADLNASRGIATKGQKNGKNVFASIANDRRHRLGRNRFQRVRGQRAVPRSRRNMQHPVLQFPLLHCLARMLGHRKRHRGLQSRSLWSGATLPRTPLSGVKNAV
jgi:hypothetical protein